MGITSTHRTGTTVGIIAAAGLILTSGVRADWSTDQEIRAAVPSPGGQFGRATALSDDASRALCGEPYSDVHPGGVVVVSQASGDDWIEEASLTGSNVVDGDSFGWSIDIDGDLIVAGAPYSTYGDAYVYRRVGGTWTEEAQLTANDGASGDRFGAAVAIAGGDVLVGAWSNDEGGNLAGAVYVFRFDGSSWYQSQKLMDLDNPTMKLGAALDSDGERAIAGAPSSDVGGSAYVLERNGGTWSLAQRLVPSDVASTDLFGADVGIDGDLLVVGSAQDDDLGTSSGSAYVYRFDGGAWYEDAKITDPDGGAYDLFGSAVDIAGDRVAVGAHKYDAPDWMTNQGTAVVFRLDGGAWTSEARLEPFYAYIDDYVGYSLDLVNGAVIVSVVNEDFAGGMNAGSAHVFRGSGCPTDLDHSGATDFDDLAGILSAWGSCPGCAADLNGDGFVGLEDLLLVLIEWGPCSAS